MGTGDNSNKGRYRPNPRRQALYAGIVMAAVLAGYGAAYLFRDNGGQETELAANGDSESRQEKPQPWYRTQAPPPAMVTAPDAPLFPDANGPDKDKARPYEEALPQEIYIPIAATFEPPLIDDQETASEPKPPAVAAQQTAKLTKETPQWRRNAVSPPPTAGKPMIVLVIDDMGVDRRRSAEIISLKGPMTLSFMTYAPNLAQQTKAASDHGHELLLHVSMEPSNAKLDAGPNVLLTGTGEDEIRRRLQWGFSRFSTYVGVNNHMGSRFTSDSPGMTVVMSEIKRRGLLFLDSRTTPQTVGADLARRMGVPYAERNIFLDNVNEETAVKARLAETERLARRKGMAIAIGHPRDGTIKALSKWLPEIEGRGFQLVPLSAVITEPDGAG
ncbi:MAG: divergent polysaccharide deacetylase family protein [Rhodospirillales bacterium]